LGLDKKYSGNMTTIELKEQMNALKHQQKERIKALKNQQKQAQKEMNRIKKEYELFMELRRDNIAFRYAIVFKGKYSSFEDLIDDNPEWDNTKMSKLQFEFLFNELKFTDVDFFTVFMSWDYRISEIPFEDRKCPVCLSYYTCDGIKRFHKFQKCKHYCCVGCYIKLPNMRGNKTCVICRQTEA